jgi:hypothetical protein
MYCHINGRSGAPPSTAACGRRTRTLLAGVAVVTVASSVFTASPASAAPRNVGLWHFDEPTGATVALDGSGTGNAGKVRGGVVTGVSGRSGKAYSFARQGSWVEVPSTASLNPGHADFSYFADIKINTAPDRGQTYDIIRKGLASSSGGEYKVEIIYGGKIKCTAKDGAGLLAAITGPTHNYADGAWHRVGCSRVGSLWSVHVDAFSRSKTVELGNVSNTKSLSLGSKYGMEDATPGLVDEVQLSVGAS